MIYQNGEALKVSRGNTMFYFLLFLKLDNDKLTVFLTDLTLFS